MKLAVTPLSLTDITRFSACGADIFIMGNEQYANRLAHSFEIDELIEASQLITNENKELYIVLNTVIHHDQLAEVESFLLTIATLPVQGIIFGDLGLYMLAKKHQLEHLLIYHPETLNTNMYDTLYWKNKNIKGLTISKEISLEEILKFKNKADIELSMIGHGHLNMFHSRRPLIENFFKYTEEKQEELINNRRLKIVEEIRNEAYPIIQDIHGTHIFREKAMQSFGEINQLATVVDVFIIDGIFQTSEYIAEVLTTYHKQLHSSVTDEELETLLQKYKDDHDTGFLHKKTVYDKF